MPAVTGLFSIFTGIIINDSLLNTKSCIEVGGRKQIQNLENFKYLYLLEA